MTSFVYSPEDVGLLWAHSSWNDRCN